MSANTGNLWTYHSVVLHWSQRASYFYAPCDSPLQIFSHVMQNLVETWKTVKVSHTNHLKGVISLW